MKKRIDYIPALLMLAAAFVACIFTIIYNYELTESMIIILVAAIVFFVFGCIIKGIASKFLVIEMDEETKEETKDEADGKNKENTEENNNSSDVNSSKEGYQEEKKE